MNNKDPELRTVWEQKKRPVIFHQGKSKPLLVRIPFAKNNREWLRADRLRKPEWNAQYKCWEVPKAWYEQLARQMLKRYSNVYLIQVYRKQQKCAPACWNATGLHCECSCMGANHGQGPPDEISDHGAWYEVSETFAFSWGPRQYACRLITSNDELEEEC